MRHLLSAIAAVLLMGSSVSHAEFLIEPYLGYHIGKYDQGSADENASGVTFGGRLGFSTMLGLQFGADYMGGEWSIDTDPDTDGTLSNIGVFVGYEFPILIRVFGSYFFDAELKDEGKLEGDMIRLGVGLSPLPFIDVNLEYITATYDKFNGASLGTDAKMNMYGVTVSVPFEL